MRFVFGYECFQSICSSRRLTGLADVMFSKKTALRQAKVLSVEQVLWMHGQLHSDCIHPTDRAIFAYVITALYGRCRHSDLANVIRILEDWDEHGGFLEIQTRTHKTAKTASNKAVLLRIVAPALGVDGLIWVDQVKDAFAQAGLPFSGDVHGPFF